MCKRPLDKVPDGCADELPEDVVSCEICSICFRRESDKKCHKCLVEHSKPVHLQKGAILATNGSRVKEAYQSTHVRRT